MNNPYQCIECQNKMCILCGSEEPICGECIIYANFIEIKCIIDDLADKVKYYKKIEKDQAERLQIFIDNENLLKNSFFERLKLLCIGWL